MSKVKGFIYILSNPEMQGLVKIGQTRRKVEKRVKELSSGTGVPAPYEIEAIFDSKNPIKDETGILQGARKFQRDRNLSELSGHSMKTSLADRITDAQRNSVHFRDKS